MAGLVEWAPASQVSAIKINDHASLPCPTRHLIYPSAIGGHGLGSIRDAANLRREIAPHGRAADIDDALWHFPALGSFSLNALGHINLPSIFSRHTLPMKHYITEAAALAGITLFIGTLLLWTAILEVWFHG